MRNLSDQEIASIVNRSRGTYGRNLDYFMDSVGKFDQCGICTKRYQENTKAHRGGGPNHNGFCKTDDEGML